MQLDPIQLEILGNKVTAVTEEMGYALQRTGRTLYVKETADFGTALAGADGKFFAYPRAIGVSGFIDLDCAPTIRAGGGLEPGDVLITNHPYASEGLATHGPDLHLVKPYFCGGEIVAYGWSFLHASDVGGRVPSSISPTSSELYQEGFMIPPMKLVRGGALNADLLTLLSANCRTPEENIGDLKAMLAALNVGERRVAAIVAQHGIGTFRACQDDLRSYAAAKAREVLRRIPDGRYAFTDYLDDDLATPYPVRLAVALEVEDGRVRLDFTGSDPEVQAAFNVPTLGKRHPWLTVRLSAFILSHDPTTPMNAGMFDPIEVVVPEGTILNPSAPAAVGVRHATAVRVNDLLNGALAGALPGVMPACSGGVIVPVVLAEAAGRAGRSRVSVVEPMVGGMGARHGADGVDGRDSSISNLANNPVETVEASAGVIVRDYALRPDSGGPGRWRGGVGLTLTIEVTAESGRILGRGMERFRFRPWGLAGGRPGAPTRTLLTDAEGNTRELGRIDVVQVRRGDRFTLMMPGAGGYGDPFERPPQSVLADVRRGLVSREGARRDYGVAILEDAVDAEETERLRTARGSRPMPAVDFGPERQAWNAALPEAALSELADRLLALPPASRRQHREAVLAAALPRLASGEPDWAADLSEPDAVSARFARALAAVPGAAPADPAAREDAASRAPHDRETQQGGDTP